MVGADALAQAAADLQDFGAAYADDELEGEIEAIVSRAGELGVRLARAARVNPSSAS